MKNNLIEIDESMNKVLNIVKTKYDLKDNNEAMEFVIGRYLENENEPDLLPEFIEKMKEIENQKSIRVENFSERYELN